MQVKIHLCGEVVDLTPVEEGSQSGELPPKATGFGLAGTAHPPRIGAAPLHLAPA